MLLQKVSSYKTQMVPLPEDAILQIMDLFSFHMLLKWTVILL
jgi:hypothetical protein